MAKLKILLRTSKLIIQAVPLNCVLALLLSLALTVYYTISVSIIQKLFESVNDYYLSNNNYERVILYMVLFVGMKLFQSILIFLNGFNSNVFIFRKATNYYKKILTTKATRLSLVQHEDDYINDMLSRARIVIKNEHISEVYIALLNITQNVFTIISISVVICSYNTWLLLIAALSVFPVLLVRVMRGKALYNIKYYQAKSNRHMNYYWELLFNYNSMKEIKTFNFLHYIKGKWQKYSDDVDRQNWEFIQKDSKSVLLSNLISSVGYILSIGISILLIINGEISIGVFGACLSAFASMQTAMKKFILDLSNISECLLFCKDYFDFIDLPNPMDGSITIKAVPDIIKVNHVYFRYPNCNEYVLKDVCLEIKRGEKIAFVGENGCGKTTLIKLILGLYEPTKGEILYDNIPHNRIKKSSLYQQVSYMMQNPLKYQTTLREAVSLSKIESEKDENKILNALHLADMDHFLDKYNLKTQLGNDFGGIELSGGEWQKIAFARTLFKDSNFVVLDEPTSSIDPIIETKILNTFLKNMKSKTAIIICHRMGVCCSVDKVVMLNKGEICEIGSHKELMQKKGYYYNLFSTQSKWYKTNDSI